MKDAGVSACLFAKYALMVCESCADKVWTYIAAACFSKIMTAYSSQYTQQAGCQAQATPAHLALMPLILPSLWECSLESESESLSASEGNAPGTFKILAGGGGGRSKQGMMLSKSAWKGALSSSTEARFPMKDLSLSSKHSQ